MLVLCNGFDVKISNCTDLKTFAAAQSVYKTPVHTISMGNYFKCICESIHMSMR